MGAELRNPYRGRHGRWVRANLHSHSAEGSICASVPLEQGVRMYRGVGTEVITVTDHDAVTGLKAVRAAYPDLVFLEGFEHSEGGNLLFIGETVPALHRLSLKDALDRADGLLTIICHPQPEETEVYWSRDEILALGRLPDGIEVFNGHYGVLGSTPQYTPFWDELLTEGHRLWGFANDDFHDPADFNHGFNMILVEQLTAAAVVRAAKSGCCYASTGLTIERILETGGHVMVTVSAACTGSFIGPGGKTLTKANGKRFEYTVTNESYVRFEAEAESGRLFLQPLFRAADSGEKTIASPS